MEAKTAAEKLIRERINQIIKNPLLTPESKSKVVSETERFVRMSFDYIDKGNTLQQALDQLAKLEDTLPKEDVPLRKKPRMDEAPSISTAVVPKKKKLVIENERTDQLFSGLVCPVLYGTEIKDVVVMGFPNPQFYKDKTLPKEEIGVVFYDKDSKKLKLNKFSACDLLRIRKTPCTECVGFNVFPEMIPENEALICDYVKSIQIAHLQHNYNYDVQTMSQSFGGVSISVYDDNVEEDTNWLNKYRKNFEPEIKDVKDLIELSDTESAEREEDDDEKPAAEQTRKERREAFQEHLKHYNLGDKCPEVEKFIKELEASGIYVYQLCYVDENGETHVVWSGITKHPDRRWNEHKRIADGNEEKRAIFEKYGDKIFMRILFKGTLAQCLMLEHLLIHNADEFGDKLVNKNLKKSKIEFKSNVMAALRQLLANAEKMHVRRTNTIPFGESLSTFVIEEAECPVLMKLLKEFNESDCFVYCLKYTTRDGRVIIKFYIGISNEPENRLKNHGGEKLSNEDKRMIIRDNKSRVFMKILFKGTRAVAEIVEQLMIQDENEPHLTNKQKRNGEKPEVEADLCRVVAELKAVEEANNVRLFIKYAMASAKYRATNDIIYEKHNSDIYGIRRSAKLIRSRNDVVLDYPEPVTNEVGVANLQGMLRFQSTQTYTVPGYKETGYTKNRYSIIPDGEVLPATQLVGSFRTFTHESWNNHFNYQYYKRKKFAALLAEQKEEPQIKKHQLLIFYARTGLLPNKLSCPTEGCTKDMVLLQDTRNQHGYKWRCNQGENQCSATPVNRHVFMVQKGIPFNIVLRIIYLFSKGQTPEQIAEKLGTNAYAAFIGPGDGSLTELVDDAINGRYETKEHFFADKTLDHLGLLLYWIRVGFLEDGGENKNKDCDNGSFFSKYSNLEAVVEEKYHPRRNDVIKALNELIEFTLEKVTKFDHGCMMATDANQETDYRGNDEMLNELEVESEV